MEDEERRIGADTLKEIRFYLNAANEHSYKKELNKWKDVLFVICKEVDYMDLDDNEIKQIKEFKAKLNGLAAKYDFYLTRGILHRFEEYPLYFDTLTNFENLLRNIMLKKDILF